MKKRLTAMLLMLVMVFAVIPEAVSAETVPPNPEGKEIPAIVAGDTMNTNRGIITAVYGTLDLNLGEVKMVMPDGVVTANYKEALIGVNKGYVYGNQGTIDENNSQLDFNEGKINENREKGIIDENDNTVSENWGIIKTNFLNGYIVKNTSIGIIQKNRGDVYNNYGTINENGQSGEVTYNRTGAKILKNTQTVYNNDGYIYNNTGKVSTNSGTVYNYSGSVNTNTGTVYQLTQLSSMPPEVKSVDFVSGFYKYGEDRFFKQGGVGKVKITVTDGYSVYRCYMSDGVVIKTGDGEYSVSNVNKPATLYVEIEKKGTESGGESTGSIDTAETITPELAASLPSVENSILNLPNDKDPAWTTFSLLKAKGVPKSKRAIKLSWKPVPGATGYVIYGNKCGNKNKYEKITPAPVSGTRWIQKKLKKGTYYKYLIAAVNGDKVLAVSKTIHVATNGGKVGNNTKVTLNKKKKILKVGKTFKLKATLKKGALKVKIHRKVAYESDNPNVATVAKNGKIRAVIAGTCYIYAYAQNGVFARCKVTVR